MGHRKLKLQVNILLVCILWLTATVWGHTICVKEESQKKGFNKSCEEYHPLKWLVNNTITNHTTVSFFPGKHYLNSSDVDKALIVFDNKYNLSLNGFQCEKKLGQKKNCSIVVCNGNQSGFLFNKSINVYIINLEFRGCRANMILIRGENWFYGGIFIHLSHNITISRVCIRDSKGYGLHMTDVCGSILIEYSLFIANEDGNVVLWLKCTKLSMNTTAVKIQHTKIQDGYTRHHGNATGINLLLLQTHTHVILINLILLNNSGKYGGNMIIKFIDYAEKIGSVSIENTSITGGKATSSGGGIAVYFDRKTNETDNYCNVSNNQIPILTIKNTTIENNFSNKSGGGLIFGYDEKKGFGCTTRKIEIINCTISHNKASSGSALEISKHNLPVHQPHYVPQLSVNIIDSYFVNNSLAHKKIEQDNQDGIVESFSIEHLVIQNTAFKHNSGTALMLVDSGVQFIENVTFEGNLAQYGGAIKICDSSKMYLNNETRVRFFNNNASFTGGAIYAGTQCPTETPPCFFQILVNDTKIKDLAQDILYFEGNHAGIAGHAIYGGSVDHCFTDQLLNMVNQTSIESYYYSNQLFTQIFHFSEINEPSIVTSDPYGICFCKNNTNQTDCKRNKTYDIEVYPGEHFPIYLSAVGQKDGIVPASMEVEDKLRRVKLEKNTSEPIALCRKMVMSIQVINFRDPNISFNISLSKTNLLSQSSNYYKYPKIVVKATLKPCPRLFELDTETRKCDCFHSIKKLIRCNIDTKTVKLIDLNDDKHIENGTWISCTQNNTTENSCKIQWSQRCQRGHCNNSASLKFNQHNLNLICTTGREGRLCSKCQPNYTLSLGISNCKPNDNCHSWGTFLLSIVFVLAGILLVCLFTIFNFTVAEGTVHGLLLYANCIQVIQYPLFNDSIPTIARVFISWLNLDFGFEVCFYAGMTAYQKIWLEFGFLFYLLLLGVIIVCLSRRFVWFTRLAGRNVVQVLATIALFAYPKLTRNSIRVWHCHNNYKSSDNNTPPVWYMDETIDCFNGKHTMLFIASLSLFIMAFLYMFCLLFIQCLQRKSNWVILRWVGKLRPFFDAYTGLYHDHYRFWPGFLLFIKMVLYIASWRLDSFSKKSYAIAGLCTLLFFLAFVFPRGVYKRWPLNVLDFSFILNLGMVSAITATNQSDKHYIVGWISLSIAVLTFALILVYHSFKRVSETRCWKRFVRRTKLRRPVLHHFIESDSESAPLIQEQRLPKIIQFASPREPLLED